MNRTVVICVVVIVVICGLVFVANGSKSPMQRTRTELDFAYIDMTLQPPSGVNLAEFEGSPESRSKACIPYSVIFLKNNQEWSLVSSNIHNPYTGNSYAHMYTVRDGVVFDPVEGVFYDRSKFDTFYSVSNTTIYNWKV